MRKRCFSVTITDVLLKNQTDVIYVNYRYVPVLKTTNNAPSIL